MIHALRRHEQQHEQRDDSGGIDVARGRDAARAAMLERGQQQGFGAREHVEVRRLERVQQRARMGPVARIAATAASHGVAMCPHWFHDVHAPLVAATPNACYVEYFWDDQVLNFRRLIDRQLTRRNGRIVLHQTPGLGFGFDEAAVARYGKWTVVR